MNRFWKGAMIVMLSLPHSFAQEKHSLSDLRWLAGCWQMSVKGRTIDEHWMKPSGGTMMGMSHTVKDGKTREYEFMRIVQNDDSSIEFIAKPSGQEQASFKLITLEGNKAVFENPTHDFPQRVIYYTVGTDSLVGRIEGKMNGKERGIDFPYRKVKCE